MLLAAYCVSLAFTAHTTASEPKYSSQVHTQFSLLSIDHAYVTSSGRLLGVIHRAQLVALQSRD